MQLLLDTHVCIAILHRELDSLPRAFRSFAVDPYELFVSAVSLWEIAMKVRLGKLAMKLPVSKPVDACEANNLSLLPLKPSHSIAELKPDLKHRDPFDRMLLTQCQVEGMLLATLDTKMNEHRLAWPRGS